MTTTVLNGGNRGQRRASDSASRMVPSSASSPATSVVPSIDSPLFVADGSLLILMVRGWRLQHVCADARLGGYVRQFVSHVIAPDAER